MNKLLLAGLLLAGVVLPARAGDDKEIGIAVLEFDSKGGISQQQMDALSDMLANEIRGRGRFRVIGKNDIRATLKLAESRAQLGCSDDSCIADIGGALGVRWIVVGNISLFGTTYLLNLKLLDVKSVKVAWSASRKITGGQDQLLDALSSAAAEMVKLVFPGGKKQPAAPATTTPADGVGKTPAASPANAVSGQQAAAAPAADAGGQPQPQQPVPVVIVGQTAPPRKKTSALETWGKVLTWTGGAALTFGAAAAVLSWYYARTYNDTGADPDDRFSARDDSRSWAGMMWIGFGSGAGLITAGILMRLFAPEEYEPAVAPALVPTPGGAALLIEGRW